jgi:hypothetical protein
MTKSTFIKSGAKCDEGVPKGAPVDNNIVNNQNFLFFVVFKT